MTTKADNFYRVFRSVHQFLEASDKMKAKGLVANFDLTSLTVESIEKATDDIIQKYEAAYNQIGQIKAEDVTFDNTIKALIDLEREMITEEGPLYFPQHVVTDKSIRDASVAAEKKLNTFEVDLSMKKEIFDNVTAFKDKFGLEGLTKEEQRFVEKSIIGGRRNGLHLEADKREKVKSVKKKISDLGTQFGFNLNEDTTHIYFSPAELDGVPADLIDSFEKVIQQHKCSQWPFFGYCIFRTRKESAKSP